MTDDEIRDYLIERLMSHQPSHVLSFKEGLEVGKKKIKEIVVKQFKISAIDWQDERS